MKRYTLIILILVKVMFLSTTGKETEKTIPELPKLSTSVRLLIQGDKELKDDVRRYISRQLQSLGDVQVVRDKPEWALDIHARQTYTPRTKDSLARPFGFTLSIAILKPVRIDRETLQALFEGRIKEKDCETLRCFIGQTYWYADHMAWSGKDLQSLCQETITYFDEKHLKPDRKRHQDRIPVLEPEKSLTNSIGMKFVYIPPGKFRMGSKDSAAKVARKGTGKPEYYIYEHPRHRVKITKGFFMGTTEVTQSQYKEVMGINPSTFKGEDNPVEKVSWNDAVEFCNRLSEKEGRTYRLPTEAEWEYACRAGTTTPFNIGETINTSQVNFDGDRIDGRVTKGIDRQKTTPVGSFQPNGFGLYDMHGNVWEWCIDWYAEDYYKVSASTDPQGPPTGINRVLRGGSFIHTSSRCRSAYRSGIDPRFRLFSLGFRVLMEK